MDLLSGLLKERRIEAYEAGNTLTPGQQVFCQKICSKIIQSQFCIVLLNNEIVGTVQRTNANVHMEYGLMLGFNKYILPFQHEDYSLEFNVAGLDTIKYNNNSFKAKAISAIDQAILQTAQNSPITTLNPDVGAYLLLHGVILSSINNQGDRFIYELGAVCGFNLCIDFTGNRYVYFGNFPILRPPVIAWRVRKLVDILNSRLTGTKFRADRGIVTQQELDVFLHVLHTMEIWILANNTGDRDTILNSLDGCTIPVIIFTVLDVSEDVSKSEMY